MNYRALAAEAVGTFALVLAGCGALMAATGANPVGPLSGALAFGFSLMALAFALGHVSGGHYNPAVTVGLVAAGRFPATNAPSYIFAQCVGACVAIALLVVMHPPLPSGARGGSFAGIAGLAAHFGGSADASATAAFAIEGAAAAVLVLVIVGSTARAASTGFAPLAIGVIYAALHLAAYPLTGAALNPARALAPAVFAGGKALADLWLFWAAPIVGAALGGLAGRWLQSE